MLARVLSMVTVSGPSGTTTLRALLYEHGFAAWADPTFASLLWGLAYVLFWLAVLSLLYRLRIFIRV